MIVGLGLDIAGIPRIAKAIERFEGRFLNRLLTPGELALAAPRQFDRPTFVAGRLAVKEATSKALGVPDGIGWHDVEVLREPSGAPKLILHGRALARAEERQVTRTHLTISHDAGVACAVVVLERD
jgi:holo-[acyl-carrier protein] synthase